MNMHVHAKHPDRMQSQTYAACFLELLELREGITKTLTRMAKQLDDLALDPEDDFNEDANDLPELVNEDGGDVVDEPHDEDTDLETTALERAGSGFVASGPDDAEDGHDAEAVNEDNDGEVDREPSLGSVMHIDQRLWGQGDHDGREDAELVNEDGSDDGRVHLYACPANFNEPANPAVEMLIETLDALRGVPKGVRCPGVIAR